MMEIFKRKDFARWQAAHRLSDEVLCKAVDEMCRGLVDASLGGELFKKRVAAHGAGKRGGYRTLLSARIGNRCVFLHGFAQSDRANITLEEQKALRFAGKVFLDLSPLALCRALQAGVLMEVCCEQQTD
nr:MULTISPECIES: type II toxin-antitoxin system RelE/ParE family toxin [Pseudomonas]